MISTYFSKSWSFLRWPKFSDFHIFTVAEILVFGFLRLAPNCYLRVGRPQPGQAPAWPGPNQAQPSQARPQPGRHSQARPQPGQAQARPRPQPGQVPARPVPLPGHAPARPCPSQAQAPARPRPQAGQTPARPSQVDTGICQATPQPGRPQPGPGLSQARSQPGQARGSPSQARLLARPGPGQGRAPGPRPRLASWLAGRWPIIFLSTHGLCRAAYTTFRIFYGGSEVFPAREPYGQRMMRSQ